MNASPYTATQAVSHGVLLAVLQHSTANAWNASVGIADPPLCSRFSSACRQADRYLIAEPQFGHAVETVSITHSHDSRSPACWYIIPREVAVATSLDCIDLTKKR
jgi:hypothetical protein